MSYKTREGLINAFKSLKDTYPTQVTYESIGKSVENRDIWVFKIGEPLGGKVVFDANMHGTERINGEILWLYANWLLEKKEPAAERILKRNYTMIIPIVNMDNYAITRKNKNGVDLNRNFEAGWGGGGSSSDPTHYAYRGTAPLSEPESKSIHDFFLREKPKFYLNMHTGEPARLYRAYSSGDKESYLISVQNKYRNLAAARGVTQYASVEIGYCGMAASCALSHDIWGFLTEFHPTVTNPPPPLEEIEPLWFPNFLPMAITFSDECGVEQLPAVALTLTDMILLFSSSLFSIIMLRYATINMLKRLKE